MKRIDLVGKSFGRLTVLRLHDEKKANDCVWVCRCECGNICNIQGSSIRRGTKSCGCFRADQLVERSTKHGMCRTSFYDVWCHMKSRCYKPNDKSYHNYGGRGIAVCDKWIKFEGFYEDMFESYRNWLTIDRIDVNGDYCKDNCRWSDKEVQGNNKRTNHFEVVDGIRDTLKNHCRRYSISYSSIKGRLSRGWNVEKAFKTPQFNK